MGARLDRPATLADGDGTPDDRKAASDNVNCVTGTL